MSDDLSAFKQLIKAHCGLQLEGLAEDRLRKALQAAVATAGLRYTREFLPRLREDPQLIKELVTQLTVNETYFFREKGQLDLLVSALIPRLFDLYGSSRPLRLFSAGCSSGEEPYSLVMMLDSAWGSASHQLFTVEAGDLDHQIVAKARRGLYSPFSFRGVPAATREKYFQAQGTHFKIRPDIAAQVRFYELNLLAKSFPRDLGNFDIICFRNVSIYFDLETRRQILYQLKKLMRQDAVLVVSSSETLANDLGVFDLVEEQGFYYFVQGQALRPKKPAATGVQASPRSRPPVGSAQNESIQKKPPLTVKRPEKPAVQKQRPSAQAVLELLRHGETCLAKRYLDELLAAGQEPSAVRLMQAWVLGNAKAFTEAEALLEKHLQTEPWSLDGIFLQALLHKWQGKSSLAEKAFKKAVYIQPDCWPAHYFLGETQRLNGELKRAAKAYQAAHRRLIADPQAKTGLQWLPLDLSRSDLLFVIEHQLQQIQVSGTTGKEGRS